MFIFVLVLSLLVVLSVADNRWSTKEFFLAPLLTVKMVSAKHTAIYLSSSFLKRLAQPRSWPSVGSVVRVSNARMKMILHTTTLSSPLLCFYSASPTLTVPHFGFKTWPVCVCLWWGRVLCFSAAQCESTVRSLWPTAGLDQDQQGLMGKEHTGERPLHIFSGHLWAPHSLTSLTWIATF